MSLSRAIDRDHHRREIETGARGVPDMSAGDDEVMVVAEEATRAAEDRVFVAVAEDVKHGKSALLWALQNLAMDGAAQVVVAHVHCPPQMIPMLGSKFHYTGVKAQKVRDYRNKEREKALEKLDVYLAMCTSLKINCEKILIENDNVAKGLEQLIALHGINKLVMGAAADKHYSKKMKTPKSKTSLRLMELAGALSCKIWFTCKGQLICTREANTSVPEILPSPTHTVASTSSTNIISSHTRAMTIPGQDLERLRTEVTQHRSQESGGTPSWFYETSEFWNSCHPRYRLSRLDVAANVPKTEMRHPMHEPGAEIFSCPHELETLGADADRHVRLEEALHDSQELKKEAYQESTKRQKADRDMLPVVQKVSDSDSGVHNSDCKACEPSTLTAKYLEKLYHGEMRQRIATEETQDLERLYLYCSEIRQRIAIGDRLLGQKCDELEAQKVMLEQSMSNMKSILKVYQEKLVASNLLLKELQAGKEKLQQERDAAVTEAEELRQKNERISRPADALDTEFSFFEIEQATRHFDKTLEIGKEGLGNVYKGWLHNTTVAIKFRHPTQSMQGQSEFNQEVAFLSRVRHPNLVMLIGSCRDTLALVYEFLPNGSLEDRMACKNNTAPLTWQARTKIISEICSTLTFLHSNKPHPVVHGNLKPTNILFDANFVTKLGDFDIGQFLTQSNTSTTRLHRKTTPKYTGSDMYSFGIIILHLLTGQPPHNIDKVVKDAIEKKKLHSVIDPCAGSWPFVQANQLAHLGLRCTEMSMKRRPALAEELWKVIEPLAKAASLTAWRPSFAASSDDASTPSDFLCPILLEVMSDPHVAADGYTYEAEAIRGWLDGGNDTSPMTNLRLAHHELTPNLSLRSVILEWQEQQQKAAAEGTGMMTSP